MIFKTDIWPALGGVCRCQVFFGVGLGECWGFLDFGEIGLNEGRMGKENCKTFWPVCSVIVQTP